MDIIYQSLHRTSRYGGGGIEWFEFKINLFQAFDTRNYTHTNKLWWLRPSMLVWINFNDIFHSLYSILNFVVKFWIAAVVLLLQFRIHSVNFNTLVYGSKHISELLTNRIIKMWVLYRDSYGRISNDKRFVLKFIILLLYTIKAHMHVRALLIISAVSSCHSTVWPLGCEIYEWVSSEYAIHVNNKYEIRKH